MSDSPVSPTFSLVIPCLNACEGLARTLASLAERSGVSLEIVVIDGGSTDGTPAYLAAAAPHWNGRLHWWSETDEGAYDAMNQGIRRAQGRYLIFLGAGDTLFPDVLQEVSAQLPPRDDALVYGDVRQHDGSRYGGKFSRWRLRVQNVPHQGIFYGRDLLKRVGPYHLPFKIYADYEFNLRCWADRTAPKIYLPLLIAHFDTPGLSAGRDTAFQTQRLALLRRYLGWDVFLLSWLGAKMPRGIRHALWLPLHRLGLLRHAAPAAEPSSDAPSP